MSVSNQQIDSANSRRKRSQQILLEIKPWSGSMPNG
jgi:hypothetical protein